MNEHYVYVYCDPTRDDEPFYVGEGKGDRYLSHLRNDGRNPRKQERIAELTNLGVAPLILFIVENLSKADARKLERETIAEIGTVRVLDRLPRGPLLNMNPGGGGVEKHSLETREKMRLSRIGKRHSEQTKEKMRRTKSIRGATESQILAWSKPKGEMSVERRGKISNSQLGRKLSDETKLKIAETRRRKFLEGTLITRWTERE